MYRSGKGHHGLPSKDFYNIKSHCEGESRILIQTLPGPMTSDREHRLFLIKDTLYARGSIPSRLPYSIHAYRDTFDVINVALTADHDCHETHPPISLTGVT